MFVHAHIHRLSFIHSNGAPGFRTIVDPTASTSTMKFAMRYVGFAQVHALAPCPARVCLALGICAVTAWWSLATNATIAASRKNPGLPGIVPCATRSQVSRRDNHELHFSLMAAWSNSKCPISIGLKHPGFLNANFRHSSKARLFLR